MLMRFWMRAVVPTALASRTEQVSCFLKPYKNRNGVGGSDLT